MSDYSKYNVPDFNVKLEIPTMYYWWSWHPIYPKWAKSCWCGATVDDAIKSIQWKTGIASDGHKLDSYHNKLIKESFNGYEEIIDIPCENTDASK